MPYPLALAVTLAVELPVYALALRALGLSLVRAAVAAVAVNLLTHPVVWLAISHAEAAYWRAFVVAELAAWLVEAVAVYAWVRRDGRLIALTALVANAGSCLAGVLVG